MHYHISKRTSRKLSRCNYGQPKPAQPKIMEPYSGPVRGLSAHEYKLFHQVRCELERVSRRKVTSEEIRGAIALLSMIKLFLKTALEVEHITKQKERFELAQRLVAMAAVAQS